MEKITIRNGTEGSVALALRKHLEHDARCDVMKNIYCTRAALDSLRAEAGGEAERQRYSDTCSPESTRNANKSEFALRLLVNAKCAASRVESGRGQKGCRMDPCRRSVSSRAGVSACIRVDETQISANQRCKAANVGANEWRIRSF